jgi:alcohol dehydrogenase
VIAGSRGSLHHGVTMRAVLYEKFQGPPTLAAVPDPAPSPDGVVLKVGATGLCRSDWHGWMGHDPDIRLPHVPGHELAGEVVAAGGEVRGWKVGDRVTVPFVCGCGTCPECAAGQQQVCDHQFQPGFTHWGSFAEYVAIDHADGNLVRLPGALDDVTAASLGCRFATSFRALVHQAEVRGGEWVTVHGCGGVGLSAILVARALGASVVAIDVDEEKLRRAVDLGAQVALDARAVPDIPAAVREHTLGGAHVSVDALGHPRACFDAIAGLRKRGRHVQVGLMLADERHPAIPMDAVVARELRIMGSHGMPAHAYPEMLRMIAAGLLDPGRLIGRRIALEDAPAALASLGEFPGVGVTVVDRF